MHMPIIVKQFKKNNNSTFSSLLCTYSLCWYIVNNTNINDSYLIILRSFKQSNNNKNNNKFAVCLKCFFFALSDKGLKVFRYHICE